jgi:hypothetical protein
MKKAKFSFGSNQVFNGYESDLSWNGWKCPLFELDEAKKVIDHFNQQQQQHGGEYTEQFTYLETVDGILSQTFEVGLHIPEYDAIDMVIIIDGFKYYDIGNYSITWELVEYL